MRALPHGIAASRECFRIAPAASGSPEISPRKRLRDRPTSKGWPSAANRAVARSSATFCAPRLANPKPGSRRDILRQHARRDGTRPRRQQLGLDLRHHIIVNGKSCIVAGVPRICISITGQPALATTPKAAGS